MYYKDIDFEKKWHEYIESKEGYSKERAFDDEVERLFFKKLSHKYDDKPTLYDYSKEVFDFIDKLIEKGKNLIEIGAGTGKFTIPLSKKCKVVIANDFSRDMLDMLEEKIRGHNITNIKTIQGKWEDVNFECSDYILSVNSLYRIWNIKDALNKMNKLAKEKVIIVRTIQKPLFNDLYIALGEKDRTCPDYIYIPNILHSLNICADIKFIDVENEIEFDSIEDIYLKIKAELNKNINFVEVVDKYIDNVIERRENKYIFKHKTKVVIIYWNSIN
ncbi:class I SAM-dependent methyltransferase [Clostridioides difficile]|nr:class I SAM-dependent methyltransferase [Clostridioides difficile]